MDLDSLRSLGQRDPSAPGREDVVAWICDWYAANARDLPWRRPQATAWHVMISEFMLQQTPVSRVLGPYAAWVERWPTPADLAAEESGAAVAAWGRLGYPRRALRLHGAARAIVERHGGEVPTTVAELRELPGVGEYTAAAIASFAHGGDHVVLDTNVRRVLGRLDLAEALPPASITRAERERAQAWADAAGSAALWAAASMELGALVCTTSSPRCEACPVADSCAWLAAGRPEAPQERRRSQPWEGTDRQCRGLLVARLREAATTGELVDADGLAALWPDPDRARLLLQHLVDEGLVHRDHDRYRL